MGEYAFKIDIDPKLNSQLTAVEENIEKIAVKSEDVQKRVDAAFSKMATGGIDQFLEKLGSVQSTLGNLNIGQNNGIQAVGTSAQTSADQVNKLLAVISGMAKALADTKTMSAEVKDEFNKAKADGFVDIDKILARVSNSLARAKSRLAEFNQFQLKNGKYKTDVKDSEAIALQNKINRLIPIVSALRQVKEETAKAGSESFRNYIKDISGASEATKAHQRALQELRKDIESRYSASGKKNGVEESAKRDEAAYKKKIKLQRQLNEESLKNYNAALRFSASAKTENRHTKAIEYLIAARKKLSVADSEYVTKLNNLNTAIRRNQAFIKEAAMTTEELAKKRAAAVKEVKEDPISGNAEKVFEFSQNAKSLEEEKQAIKYLIDLRNNALNTQDRYVEKMQYINSLIQEHQKHIKDLGKTEQQLAEEEKKDNDKRIAESKRLAKQKESERKALEAEKKAYELRKRAVMDAWFTSNSSRALSFSKNTKNINEEIRAIKYLTEARNNLNKNTQDYNATVRKLNSEIQRHRKNIDKLTESNHKLQTSHHNLMDTAGQLKRSLALLFSVSALKGYVNKLVDVRGEFELQQRSLEALLQDKDEADKLWNKTVELAVKSPFRVKELVTYTKQLAAYRVESDKLYETNKMLADVSAGLGVDMNRLILAFGQVKAANFLRGTELRQFSEAGVNMLGELSKYFTELEGRMVSVGEVFQRVSKRMVSFSDVEKVFKRITSEGGAFYKMQEIQSETLKGMISNLRDSVDLMLNYIGKSNQGTLKDAVSSVKEFVENWREAAYVLGIIIKMFAAYTIATKLAALGNTKFVLSMADSITTFRKTQSSLSRLGLVVNGLTLNLKRAWKAVLAFGRGFLAAIPMIAIGWIIASLIEWRREATKTERALEELNKELGEIYNQDGSKFRRSIDVFKDLVERTKEVNKGSREHKKIIEELNSQYGEYLGFVVDEKTTYDQLKASIDGVNQALAQKARANTYEKALSTIYEKSSKQIMSLRDALEEDLARIKRVGSDIDFLPEEKDIENLLDLYEEKVKKLEIDPENFLPRDFKKLLKDYFGGGKELDVASNFRYLKLRDLGRIILNQKEKEEEIMKRINQEYGKEVYSTKKMREEMEKLEKSRLKALADLSDTNPDDRRRQEEEIEKEYGIKKVKLKIQFQYQKEGETDEDFFKREAERINKEVNSFLSKYEDPTIKHLNKVIKENEQNLGAKYADMIYIDKNAYATGIGQIAQSAAEAYKSQEEIIKNINGLKKQGMVYNEAELENAEKAKNAYYFLLKIMGQTDLLEKGNGSNSKLAVMNRQLNALKKSYEAFQKYKERHSEEESKRLTAENFKDLFSSLEMSYLTKDMDYDEIGIIRVLKNLPNIAKKAGATAIENLITEMKNKIGEKDLEQRLKTIKDSMDNAFSDYQMSIELQKIGVPESVIENFTDGLIDEDDLKKQIDTFNFELGLMGNRGIEIWNNAQNKMTEITRKSTQDRLKIFLSYLSDVQNQILAAQNKGAFDIAFADNLFNAGKIDASQYTTIVEGIVHNVNEEVSKIRLDKFKESPEYIAAMGDMAAYSAMELENMANKLKDMIASSSGLSVDEIKAYNDALTKIQEQMEQLKSPFEKSWIGKLKEINRLEKELTNEKNNQLSLEQKLTILESQKKMLKQKLEELSKEPPSSGRDLKMKGIMQDIKNTTKQIDEVNSGLNESEGNTVKISKAMKAIGINSQSALEKVDAVIKGVHQSIEATVKIFNDVKSVAEAFGANTEGKGWKEMSIAMETLGGVNNEVMQGWNNFKSGNIAGAIANTVGAVTQLIGGFAKIHDAKYERRIQKEQKAIEKLERAYEKLGKAMEDAYSINTLKETNKNMEANIRAQIGSLNRMIQAEDDKKKTDKEKIAEWRLQVEELQEKLKELNEQMIEDLGAFGSAANYKNAAQEFSEAWFEAYKETGDGMKALEDTFEGFMNNIVKKQLLIRGTEAILKPLLQMIDKSVADDATLTKDELNNINKLFNEKTKEQLNSLYQSIVDSLGIKIDNQGALSGLQEGIQGITESTAQIIESYLNSIRFFVSDTNSKLSAFVDSFTNTEIDNPIIAQLKIVAANTTAIRSLLDSLTAPHPTQSGRGLKVII